MKSKALIALAGIAVLASCNPTEYRVERHVTIDAPAELVFDHVNNHKLHDAWSPWERMDTTMEKSYEGPEAGVGAIYRWSGNDSVGTGVLEITESVPHEYIKSTLTFTAPWESESTVEWDFVETDGGVMASWAVNGELPGFMFWMGEEDMDEMMGKDFQRGLDMLKIVAEEKVANMPGTPMSVIEIEAMPVYFIEAETSIKNMESSFFGDKYEKIGAYLGADTQNMLESPLAIYKVWDEENDKAQVAVGMACESEKPGEGDIQKVMSHEGKAVECEYMGSYEGGKGAHNAIAAYMETNSLEMAGSPWEVYVAGPATEPDSTKWVTKIYYHIL
jgi:effector-binding domain-containing protein/uncharacterized protein YndB with AHSA1/START domain